jgi:ribosomal protein L7/L12
MWCPHCREITVCAAVDPASFGNPSGQRWQRTDHTDIQWFRRGRVCQTCGHGFLTAEANEQFIGELVELRDALREIKANAEAYVAESSAAAGALSRLTASLNVLRALQVYQQTAHSGVIELTDEESQLALSGNKLAAVQSLRKRTALGLAEAVDLVNAHLKQSE